MSVFIKESLCTAYKLGCSFTTQRLKQLHWFSPPSPCHPLVLTCGTPVLWLSQHCCLNGCPIPSILEHLQFRSKPLRCNFFFNCRVNFIVNQFVIYRAASQTVVYGKLRGRCGKRWKRLWGSKKSEGIFHRAAVLWNCLHGEWAVGCVMCAWRPFLSLLLGPLSWHSTEQSRSSLNSLWEN